MESNVLSEAAGGLYRDKAAFYAPEEVMGLPLSEKVDLYALGAIIHYILLGYRPFKSLKSDEVFDSIERGTIPKLPPGYISNDDPLLQALLTVMTKCYEFDQERARPHAKDIVKFLINSWF